MTTRFMKISPITTHEAYTYNKINENLAIVTIHEDQGVKDFVLLIVIF